MNDLIAELERVRRSVGSDTAPDGPVHVVELRRTYDAPTEDVWDACTNRERIPRWFLPVTGDLRPGGRFQLKGNAGGEITECEPPRRLAVTWEFGGEVSLVTLELAPAGDAATELVLRHAVPDNDHWATYGPGATGVGWDLALLGLALHLRAGAPVDPNGFETSPEAREFMRRSAADWGAAHVAAGAQAADADEAAARTSAFYAPDPERAV
jgi:uncharacterized protein YndB with AHSA1/START domain